MDARDALDAWVRDGLIPDELADRLRDTLDDVEPREIDTRADERPGLLIRLLVFVGALLIGGALLLFIGSQWDESSPTRRLLLLFAVYLAVVGAAALAGRQRLDTTSRGLWFLSSVTVGVNIFLVGQIFNLALNYWQGTLLWMIASLAMGWAAPSAAQGWLATVLGLLTLGWLSVPAAQFYDQGAFLVDAGGIRPLLPLIGISMLAGAALTADTTWSWLAPGLRAIGVVLVAAPFTVSTFHPFLYAWFFQIDARLFHVLVIVASLAVVAILFARRRTPLVLAAVPPIVALVLVQLPQVSPSDTARHGLDGFDSVPWLGEAFADSALLFGIYTAVVFALALGTVAVGLQYRLPALVNVGVAVIAVLLTALYIGRLAGALPTSLAVGIGGVLLVAGAVLLERKRRDLVEASR